MVTDVTIAPTPQWKCGLSYINDNTLPQPFIFILMHTPSALFFVLKIFAKLYVLDRRMQSMKVTDVTQNGQAF